VYEKLDLDAVTSKHIDLIQGVVSRLATDSFLMKGWGLTVAAAFFGLSAKDISGALGLVGLMPICAFWGLDAYFLSRERLYRLLYESVRRQDGQAEPLSMDCVPFTQSAVWSKYTSHNPTWLPTMRSATLFLFYGPVVAVGVAVTIYSFAHH